MPRLNPKNNYHTTTDTKWCPQRELTNYSFQPFLTSPVRPPTPVRLMAPTRSRWPKALLVPSVETWQPQVTISNVQPHQFTVPLFTTHTVPKEVRHWQVATDASSAETTEIEKSKQRSQRGEPQPMHRLKLKVNYHTTTDTKWRSQRQLTYYSFQPFVTIPVRSCTSSRLMAPARSRWPIALLVPSIETWQPQVTISTAQHR